MWLLIKHFLRDKELSRSCLRNLMRILDQDGEVRRCGAHRPIKNISTWGSIFIANLLVEGHLYNQGCKKDTSMIGSEGEKVNQVRTSAPEGTQKKGRMHGQTAALWRDWFKLHVGCPSPEVLHRRSAPLAIQGTAETNRRAVESRDCACEESSKKVCAWGRVQRTLLQWLLGFLWLLALLSSLSWETALALS